VTSDAPSLQPVSLNRTPRGWAVNSSAGTEDAADLVEGLSLADLVAEELGVLVEPDRTARRSARGAAGAAEDEADPVDVRLAELERTVAQLEHALAARVSTERAIGVLAERHAISARAAFESLRGDARSQGRPVAALAREVLDSLSGSPASSADQPTSDGHPLPAPRERADGTSVAAADGRS
jgi:ANTAR domain-containing protein